MLKLKNKLLLLSDVINLMAKSFMNVKMDIMEKLKHAWLVLKTVLNVLLTKIVPNVPELYGLKQKLHVTIVPMLNNQVPVPHVNLKMPVTPENVPKKTENQETVLNVKLSVVPIV